MNSIFIPVQLRPLTGGRDNLTIDLTNKAAVESRSLRLLLDLAEGEAPGLKTRLLDQEGKLRRFINVFIDGQDARTVADEQDKRDRAKGQETDPAPGATIDPLDLRLSGFEEVSILPAIAGG